MSKVIKGKFIRFFIKDGQGRKEVFHATNVDLEFGADTEKTVTKDGTIVDMSGRTWSGSGEGLLIDDTGSKNNFKLLHDAYMSDELIEIEIGLPTGNLLYTGAPLIAGKAFITSLSVSAPAEGSATVSYSFEGDDVPTVTYPV